MFNQEQDWEFHPLSGGSGEAFMGVRKDEKVFFKRNASPIITALSAEGIAPKLMWTQRTYSGDTLTAQQWEDGQVLERDDLFNQRVIDLIRQIHDSDHLLMTLKRVGEVEKNPLDFIVDYYDDLPAKLQSNQLINSIVDTLRDQVDDDFYQVSYRVCHGDLNHHNFLLTHDDHLYMVDWENVCIADPVSDLAKLMVISFPPSQWSDWLAAYGQDMSGSFYKRMCWYSQVACLSFIKQYYNEDRPYQVNQMILNLKTIHQEAKDL